MTPTKVLRRVQAPRTKVAYDLEVGGAISKKELPAVFGLLGWPEAMIKSTESFELNNINIEVLDLEFSELLQDLCSVDNIEESKFFEVIDSLKFGVQGEKPYSAVFIHNKGALSPYEVSVLSYLTKTCHVSFIFCGQSCGNSGLRLLEHLCQKFSTDGWFYHSSYSSSTCQIIPSNSESDDVAGLMLSLCASRWAHYVKVIMREGASFSLTAVGIEDYFNTWLCGYVLLDDLAPEEVSLRYPLKKGVIRVSDSAAGTHSYKISIDLCLRAGFNDCHVRLDV